VDYLRIALGVLRWTIAVAAVLGTLALLSWIAIMLVKKDK
jgi:hypothetical protein